MLVVFMGLILSKKVSTLTALVTVPIVFGLIAGFGVDTFIYAMKGIIGVGTTISMLVFAILYFGIMLCTGLFDPLSGIALKFMKGDPFRVILGTAILATLVSLDGDGTTTIMICCAALLPVYKKLGINPLYLALFIILPNGVINLLPWGGPTASLLAVTNLDSNALLMKLIPLMLINIAVICGMAAFAGLQERKRLTIVVLLAIVVIGIPGPLVFAFGAAVAMVVNYHDLKEERKVIEYNAEGIVNIVLMLLGAGILMGILNESGMAEGMAQQLLAIIPESWKSAFAFLVALISGPAVWILNNNAFYFGIYPVLAETATTLGFDAMNIGLVSLLGQALRGFSPVIPALYFMASYVGVEFSDFQKKAIPYSVVLFAANLLAGLVLGWYAL